MKSIFKIIAGFMMFTNLVQGQDQNIKDYLDAYLGENAVPYVQPLADLFASNINTGVWEWSKADTNFYFRLKAQAIISYPAESMRTFTGHTSGDFKPAQTVSAPTIIGDRTNIILQGEDSTFYIFPGGYDLNRLTLGSPHLLINFSHHISTPTSLIAPHPISIYSQIAQAILMTMVMLHYVISYSNPIYVYTVQSTLLTKARLHLLLKH